MNLEGLPASLSHGSGQALRQMSLKWRKVRVDAMIPPDWMIEELERLRKERERGERWRPQLHIEIEPPGRAEREPARPPREPIIIDLG